jgi:hypothetical protein
MSIDQEHLSVGSYPVVDLNAQMREVRRLRVLVQVAEELRKRNEKMRVQN